MRELLLFGGALITSIGHQSRSSRSPGSGSAWIRIGRLFSSQEHEDSEGKLAQDREKSCYRIARNSSMHLGGSRMKEMIPEAATIGTVAITDYGWYEFLSRRRIWEEVNFWTPSARFAFRAPEFSPFFFKLRAPHNAIVGFGYFASYAVLPDWLAWECFTEGNGCSSFDEMRERLIRIRRGYRYAGSESVPHIGCIVLVNAVFFQREEWVAQPADWPVRAQRPKRYDLTNGEGARVWRECLQRWSASEERIALDTGSSLDRETNPRYGSPTLVRPRLGQGAFRVAVTQAYRRACAVTGEHSLPALEAAHIRPFSKAGPNTVRNGILFRADLHRLFERGYITVTPDTVLEVSDRLRKDFENGRTYYPLHGTRISVPQDPREHPDPSYLSWHNECVYVG